MICRASDRWPVKCSLAFEHIGVLAESMPLTDHNNTQQGASQTFHVVAMPELLLEKVRHFLDGNKYMPIKFPFLF